MCQTVKGSEHIRKSSFIFVCVACAKQLLDEMEKKLSEESDWTLNRVFLYI